MKNVHGDLNTNRDKNTESVEWKYNASNAILPFFPDKLRLLFFASHLVSFRISLDNEKDILRRLMNDKDSRSRLNLSEYIARASRCSDFQLLSFSLFFFLFIPFNLPHGREFKWAQIVNTWDNEEFSRLCVNGQLWSFIKICEIKKKKERAIRRRETSKRFATENYKIPHLLVPFAWRYFRSFGNAIFSYRNSNSESKKNSHSTCFSIFPFLE